MSGKVGDAREVALNVLRQMFDEGANTMFDTTHDRELALEMLRRGLSASPQDGCMEGTAQFLWALLDDIDTASDAAKANDKAYRAMVERIQRRRFEVGSTDGYTVKLRALPQPTGDGT